ncbi:MAG TPA: hypothetical protein VG052_17370, partial [Puia sp.]|nr:hypothetical protein [Puia sp.]
RLRQAQEPRHDDGHWGRCKGIPLQTVVASGGGGIPEHFADILGTGRADAALAASIFHFKEITIPELKGYLQGQGIAMRI